MTSSSHFDVVMGDSERVAPPAPPRPDTSPRMPEWLRSMAARERLKIEEGEALDRADYHEGTSINDEGLEIPS